MARLKVYRTPIGFHDAYVAAPSQTAALAAWGSDANLFARGAAEEVTDPALTAEPLARPGEVVKRSRGSADEQLAALTPDKPKAKAAGAKPASRAKAVAPKVRPPRPDRADVEAAERAIAAAEQRQREEERALAAEEAALAERRRRTRAAHDAEMARLGSDRDAAERAYDAALKRWREAG